MTGNYTSTGFLKEVIQGKKFGADHFTVNPPDFELRSEGSNTILILTAPAHNADMARDIKSALQALSNSVSKLMQLQIDIYYLPIQPPSTVIMVPFI